MAEKKLNNSDDQALIQKERDYISGADVTPISTYAYTERLYDANGDSYRDTIITMYDPPMKVIETIHNIVVAGTFYQKNSVNKLIKELKAAGTLHDNRIYKSPNNEIIGCMDVDDRIWQYTPVDLLCKLVPEPTNKHDENAIMVFVSDLKEVKWFNVGYIPRDKTDVAKELIKKGTVYIAELYGGKYKTVYENDYGSPRYGVEVIREPGVCFKVKWD